MADALEDACFYHPAGYWTYEVRRSWPRLSIFVTLWHVSPVYLLQHGRPCHAGAAKPRLLCSS